MFMFQFRKLSPPPKQMQGPSFEPEPFLESKPCVSLRAGGRLAVLLLLLRLLGSPWGGVLWGALAGGFGGVVGSALDPWESAGGPHWIHCARAGLVLGFCGFKDAAATLPTCAPPKATRKCALRTLGPWSSRIIPKPQDHHQIIPKGRGRSSCCVTIIKVDFHPPVPPHRPHFGFVRRMLQ